MKSDTARMILDQVFSALALLTRLPVPNHRPAGAASAWAWPLVGAGLGALAALAASVALTLGLPPGPASGIALAVLALLTGALHEDGLADTADGLMGGATPERRLEIMKDSRIGSFGALALILITLTAWSSLTALLATGGHWPALITASAISRAPMAAIMAALPPARSNGLSATTGRPAPHAAILAAGLALAIALAFNGTGALTAIALAAGASLALALSASTRIGGQTGDILGASQQIAFAISLAALA